METLSTFIITALSVLTGAGIANIITRKNATSMREMSERQIFMDRKIIKDNIVEKQREYANDDFARRIDKLKEAVKSAPNYEGGYGRGEGTSSDFNANWARAVYGELNLTDHILITIKTRSDEFFERISGSLYELVMARIDLQWCQAEYDHAEKMLEFEKYFSNPLEIADHKRALRHHNERKPYLIAVYEKRKWRAKYTIMFWDMHLGGKSSDEADRLARQEMGDEPEWPNNKPLFTTWHQDHLYISYH